jgi:predicted peroxiredoxin
MQRDGTIPEEVEAFVEEESLEEQVKRVSRRVKRVKRGKRVKRVKRARRVMGVSILLCENNTQVCECLPRG